MKRGDIILVSLPGDYGKPRPAVIVQSDYLTEAGAHSCVLCPITSHLEDADLIRLSLKPSARNGLKKPSQVMADKIFTIPKSKIKDKVGTLDSKNILALNRMLAFIIGLAE